MAREMKDSGVAWIGKIPAKWSIVKIKAGVYKVGSGKTPSGGATTYADEGILFLRSQNVYNTGLELSNPTYITPTIDEEMKGTRVFPNDVLLNITGGSIGRCCIFPESLKTANVNQHVSIIRVNQDVFLPEYMHYYWVSPLGTLAIELYQTGGNREGMSADAIKNTPIILIPLDEQKRICKALDDECSKIDNVLTKTRASIEEYKKLKQAIITQAVTKGMQKDRTMKDSGIEWVGEIPADWESTNPKALFSQRKEKAIPGERKLTSSQKYGIIYQDDYMDLTGSRVVVVQKDFDILKHVEVGDFIISMRSFQGGLEYSTKTGSISSAYVMLTPNLNLVYPRFYRWLLKSEVYIRALQRTSNMVRDGQAIRYSNFAQIRLYTVPLQEQMEIADYLDEKCAMLDALIEKKEKFVSEIESYKKSLIYEYVTGKKEV